MLGGFKKDLLPWEMIRGRLFSEMIRIQPKSQSYRPKVGAMDQMSELQPGWPPESEPNRPEKGPNGGSGACTETPPLKNLLESA